MSRRRGSRSTFVEAAERALLRRPSCTPLVLPTIAASPEGGDKDGGLHTVASPMLGTFYRAQAPGAAPFVDVGARVEPDTVVCLIEVMKMMNSVPAGIAGTIVEVCAENAQLVEDGAPLFQVRSGR